MHSMNTVFLMGNLTRDPELRELPSGVKVAELGLAVNDRYKNKDGEWVNQATFVDIITWGRLAENCGQYLKKGSPVMVEGKLQLDQWESETGEKRSKMRVRAWRIQFLEQRSGGDDHAAEPAKAGTEEDMPF